jgi:hypothetical protein
VELAVLSDPDARTARQGGLAGKEWAVDDFSSYYNLSDEELEAIRAGGGVRRGRRVRTEPGRVERGVTFALGLTSYALAVPFALVRPVTRTEWFGSAVSTVLTIPLASIDTVISVVLARLRQHPDLQLFVDAIADRLLNELQESEVVAALVRAQADRYVAELTAKPETLDKLVSVVADRYIGYLQADPALVNRLVDTVAGEYLAELTTKPGTISPLVQAAADGYLAYLDANPEVLDAVVQETAKRIVVHLQGRPEMLDGLVQAVGDRYIDYLRDNPEGVQDLLHGQTQSMATGVVGEVRERSARIDQRLESVVRKALGKPARDELGPVPGKSYQNGSDRSEHRGN